MMRLGLGTVQFGINYGITNQSGHVAQPQVREILDAARGANVGLLDTATLYGNSETILGQCGADSFKVVSKTPRFADGGSAVENSRLLKQFALASLKKLQIGNLYALLAHHAPNLLASDGQILWAALRELRAEGVATKIGASVYYGEDIDALLERYEDLDLIQLPMNILDQRLIAGGQIARLLERGVEIHVRSIFLQGLLLQTPERIPSHLNGLKPWLERWHLAAAAAELSPMAAAFAFVKSTVESGSAIVGVTSAREFDEVRTAFESSAVFDATGLACNDNALIDPSHWSRYLVQQH
jgi:aryl-alcohol dehydrogenase-like predicted oxidoreductase